MRLKFGISAVGQRYIMHSIHKVQQEGPVVASLARDDPPLNSRNIGGGHVCWGSYGGFNFAGWRSRCVLGMHRDHNAPACTATRIVSCDRNAR